MKIQHLLDDISIIVSNEEQEFIKNHQTRISLSSLTERDSWTAQNLVRKGLYKLTNDGKSMVLSSSYAKK